MTRPAAEDFAAGKESCSLPSKRGADLLRDPLLNKGTAFTREERVRAMTAANDRPILLALLTSGTLLAFQILSRPTGT